MRYFWVILVLQLSLELWVLAYTVELHVAMREAERPSAKEGVTTVRESKKNTGVEIDDETRCTIVSIMCL